MEETTSQLGLLRPVKESELEMMLSWRNDPSVRQNMYTTHKISLTEHLSWWKRQKDSNSNLYFMYEHAGQPLGVVSFSEIDRSNQNSAWAFYASPGAPKGTGFRMEALALDYAFCDLNLHKLYCEVLAFNTPVIKLHEKFGFKTEGVFRDHYKRDNEFIDIYRLGLMCDEWARVRDEMINKLRKLTTR